MKTTLYVANLAEAVDEAALAALFGEQGEVAGVEIHYDERIGVRYALVRMVAEKAATKALNGLNGHALQGRNLAISYPAYDPAREMTSKQRKAYEAIAEALGETEKVPLRELEAIVQVCGVSFAQALLKETEEIEAAGGLMTSDGAKRRTKGGVFFYLARYRMSRNARYIVYNRKGKLPPVTANDDAAPDEAAAMTMASSEPTTPA
jgi:hypothetical protein